MSRSAVSVHYFINDHILAADYPVISCATGRTCLYYLKFYTGCDARISAGLILWDEPYVPHVVLFKFKKDSR